ncbi:MAG: ATP-binding cassette domain-containing protein [Candidatus Helarchaeota archaeon]
MGFDKDFVKVINVTKKFNQNDKEIIVLNKINMSLALGEIFGLIGEFGSGKSTLLRILRGVETYNDGSVEIGGSTKLKDLSVYYPQHYFGLYDDSVINNLIRKLNIIKTNNKNSPTPFKDDINYKEMKSAAENILIEFDLIKSADLNVKQLTTSEKQLLVLLRQFILNERKLLILDNPWGMAHPLLIQKIINYLKKLKELQNVAIIIASENINALQYICDRIGLLHNGNLKIDNGLINQFIQNKQPLFPFKPLELPNSDQFETLIQMKNIQYKNVFNNFNLDVFKGEILGIIGDNKSGKTSLIKLLSGLYIPDSGKVVYINKSSTEISKFGLSSINILKNFCYISQELTLINDVQVKNLISLITRFKMIGTFDEVISESKRYGIKSEILDAIIRLCSNPWNIPEKKLSNLGIEKALLYKLFPKPSQPAIEQKIITLLENFNISNDILDRNIEQLSFIEIKILLLIIHLAFNPDVIFLDEFDSDCDIITKRKIVNYLLKINSQYQTTIIFSTHDPNFLKELSHRAIILEHGKIDNINSPENIYSKFLEMIKGKIEYEIK